MNTKSKGRRIAAWVLIGLISAVLSLSAIAKLTGSQPVVEIFEKWGLRSNLFLIGVVELISALLFVFPRTHSLGLLLITALIRSKVLFGFCKFSE